MDQPIDNPPPVLHKGHRIQIRQTPIFNKWLRTLRDRSARSRIVDRLKRLALGHVGDTKPLGDNVHELRFAFGPGYRIYYIWKGDRLVFLLSGGDKDSQSRDIVKAKALAKEANDGIENTPL